MDFTEFETRMGGIWRVGGVADYWSKLELGWHVSTTANHRDAIETLQQAIAETERLLGQTLRELLVDDESGEIRPIAVVTDNGPCFKAARFAAYIETRPELIHIRTRRRTPQQNGVRERAFGSLKYEHLYRLEIDDGYDLGIEAERYRQLFNTDGTAGLSCSRAVAYAQDGTHAVSVQEDASTGSRSRTSPSSCPIQSAPSIAATSRWESFE